MFTIDLLKGEGVPTKGKLEGIAIAVVTLAVPIVIAMVVFSIYLSDTTTMSIQKRDTLKYVEKTNELSDAVKLQESFEKEKNAISSSLSEVASSIGKHTQWTPILTTLVKNMPDSMLLTRLEVKQHPVKIKVPRKDDPEKTVEIRVPARTLRMNLCGSPQYNCDKAVKDFRDRLRSSTSLGAQLENIRVSQEFDTLEGRDVVCYQIDCVFKPVL